MKLMDLTGKRYGRLIVSERAHNKGKDTMWLCKCECGSEKEVRSINLRSGNTKSCGCLSRDKLRERSITHGASYEPWYGSWMAMVRRMTNPEDPAYQTYVIDYNLDIDPDFIDNPWEFYKEIGEFPGKGHSIERVDNSKGYIKGNIKWATPAEQSENKNTYKGSKSGVSGVNWNEKLQKWAVRVYYKNKTYFCGRYNDLEEAKAVQTKRKKEIIQEMK